jgi:hypothetical protein
VALATVVHGASPGVHRGEGQTIISIIVRPLALQLSVAVVSYLWARCAAQALRRAASADEPALLERAAAEDCLTVEASAFS